MSPGSLRSAARERTQAALARAGAFDVMAQPARPIPIAVLGSALGVAEDDLPALVESVGVVAAAYFLGIAPTSRRRPTLPSAGWSGCRARSRVRSLPAASACSCRPARPRPA